MRTTALTAALALGAAIALGTSGPADAAANKGKAASAYGKPTGKAKSNVNRPKPSSSYNRPAGGNQTANRNQNNATRNAKKGGNNVVAGNTVVVGGRPPAGNGYYNNGNYYGRPDWDDDDDDFLEFVGKTAAVTAGVSAVTAVIGSVVNDKPSGDCQPVNAYGQQYLYCNGTYYQAAPQSGPNAYQVVAPPQ